MNLSDVMVVCGHSVSVDIICIVL